jgi:hypothetical protein
MHRKDLLLTGEKLGLGKRLPKSGKCGAEKSNVIKYEIMAEAYFLFNKENDY